MSKYDQAVEKQIDNFIAFMEVCLIRRKFTSTETANMRKVLYTIVHTAQLEAVSVVADKLKNNLNEDNAPLFRKLVTVMKSF